MSKSVTKLSNNFVREFSSVFTKNKGYIELFIVTLLCTIHATKNFLC